MQTYIQVVTTVENAKDAQAIATALLNERVAACVQIVGPVSSHYWWKGKITRASEYMCLIKSRQDQYEQVESAIKRVHPYEIPEIIATPISAGNKDYLQWIDAELDGED
jgi:periplasmic divalent cation tolerance protein